MIAPSLQMKRSFLLPLKYWASFFSLFMVIVLPALAQTPKIDFNKEDFFNKGTVTAGNIFYRVAIEDILGNGVGLYTVRTGSRHPITLALGKPQDLLAGGTRGPIDSSNVSTIRNTPIGRPGTSYTTIRSYTTRTDYVQTEFVRPDHANGFERVWLDSTFINNEDVVSQAQYLTKLDTTGYMITYRVPGLSDRKSAPDSMIIRQIIKVHGTDFNDSWVEISTTVVNLDREAIEIGIRYLWDLNIGNDDGPELFEQAFSEFLGETERSINWVNFGYLRVVGINPNPVGTSRDSLDYIDYNVYCSALTPTNLKRVPLQPTRIQQVGWLNAFFKPFSYEVNPNAKVTVNDGSTFGLPGGDSAVQFFWGEALDNAITIPTGDSVQVTQALFATPAGKKRIKSASDHEPPLDTKPLIYDHDLPICEITKWQFEPKRLIEVMLQDEISGLRALKVHNLFNANIIVTPAEMKTGSTEPFQIVVTAINEAEPVGFLVEAADLCGNQISCDPIFLTLKPELRVFNYTVEPQFSDRYFYIKNQGVRRIVANLNGHEFILSAESEATLKTSHTISMPLNGEITIDVRRYLKEDGNTLNLAYEGPEGSRADLVLSDMKMKNSVDLELNLSPLPQQFALRQNWPNPFRSGTTIQFEVPTSLTNPNGTEKVEIKIYNLLGQLVRTLVDVNLQAGSYNMIWNGRDENGRPVAAGVYLYNLTAGKIRIAKKMALIR